MASEERVLWSRVSAYLDEALELDPAQREPWLATLEASEPAVAGELRELLALHAANRLSGFMERSALRTDEQLTGKTIGPYTIERLLARITRIRALPPDSSLAQLRACPEHGGHASEVFIGQLEAPRSVSARGLRGSSEAARSRRAPCRLLHR